MNKVRVFLAVFLLAVISIGAHSAVAEHPPHVAPAAAPVSAPVPLAAVGGDHPGDVFAAFDVWVREVEREQKEREAEAAMAAARRNPSSSVADRGAESGVGDCTGFTLPDAVIIRESRGNPYAVNASSGAFGCAQVMPVHWNPGGACEGLDRYSIEDQRTCVGWLSEDGTRLSPWGGG